MYMLCVRLYRSNKSTTIVHNHSIYCIHEMNIYTYMLNKNRPNYMMQDSVAIGGI